MKRLVEMTDANGMEALMGEVVTIFCVNYFYTGTLVGVNETCVVLKDPRIVYDTGSWTEKEWKDVQTLPTTELYVQCSAIEAFGVLK